MVEKDFKKIKVLVIGMSNNKAGVETFITNVFDNIDRGNFEFHFCSSQEPGDNYKHLESFGAIIHRIPATRHNVFQYYKYWNNLFKKEKFDAVLYNACDIVSVDILKFARKHRVPIRVLHSHNTGVQFSMNKLHEIQDKRNRKNLDKVATDLWACSAVAGDWMFDGRQYKLINNGITVKKYKFSNEVRENARKEFCENDEKIICFIGRMSAQKNPIKAINVFENYLNHNANTKLLFVGQGDLDNFISQEIDKRGLNQNVLQLGSRGDIPNILMASDSLLMTSDFEGLPFVLVEAQCSGLPCVVIDNVSKESELTDLVNFVPNDSSFDVWNNVIDNALNRNMDRTIYADKIVEAGFDIGNTSKYVSEFLKGNN